MKRSFPFVVAALSIAILPCKAVRAAEDQAVEEHEVKLPISDEPKHVLKTLRRESFGAEIRTVDIQQMDGRTVYEVDVKIDGLNYEIVVGKDGRLISKAIDHETDEAQSDKADDASTEKARGDAHHEKAEDSTSRKDGERSSER